MLALELAEGAQLVAKDRMYAGRAPLESTDVHGGCSEVDLINQAHSPQANAWYAKRTIASRQSVPQQQTGAITHAPQ
jgi:hypothetical protein